MSKLYPIWKERRSAGMSRTDAGHTAEGERKTCTFVAGVMPEAANIQGCSQLSARFALFEMRVALLKVGICASC
jgi:hypothetical protein